jgi:regulator of protease activity HflC (stomatin/prohibitin superfamily)
MRCGRDKRAIGPGLYWMWPVIDDIERMSVVPQVNAMQAQSCITVTACA